VEKAGSDTCTSLQCCTIDDSVKGFVAQANAINVVKLFFVDDILKIYPTVFS
jgi:hypothetical protein